MFFGDYHTHTTYSHGKCSIEDNVKAAVAKGLKEIAITDHGFGHVAYGVKRREFPVMRKEVDRLKPLYPQIKIMLGLECNFISSNGDVDLREGERDLLDIMVCGSHVFAWASSFSQTFSFALPNTVYTLTGGISKKSIVKNTDAYIKLVEKNKVDIISHLNYAIKADAVEVAKACKHYGTMVELNGKRINLTDEEIEKMVEAEVDFIVNSDAHHADKVGNFSVPLSVVDRLHIPAERICNLGKKPILRGSKV